MTAKTDMERVALFKEMGYHTVGDPYKSPGIGAFNQGAYKGKQMLPGGLKERSGKSDGYFAEYSRVFSGEAYTDPIKIRRQERKAQAQRNIGKSWTPSSPPKAASGSGSTYGTFGGALPNFSPASKGKGAYKAPGKNILTSPAKRGTGYGYTNVTLGSYPEYKGDAYERGRQIMKKDNEHHKAASQGRAAFKLNSHSVDFFDLNPYQGGSAATRPQSKINKDVKPFRPSNPGKRDGGAKIGTFDPFPTYSSDPYKRISIERKVHVVNNTGKTYIPNSFDHSAPQNSILQQSVDRRINGQNYRAAVPAFM